MKLLKDTSIYIKKFFSKESEDVYLNQFWNSLFIGFALLSFGINLPTPFFIIAMILGITALIKNRNFNFSKTPWVLLFPVYYFILVISLIYTDHISKGLDLIQRCIPILVFPVVLVLIEKSNPNLRRLFGFLVVGLIITFFINLSTAFYNSISFIDGSFVFDTSIEGGYSFFESFSHGGSYFIGGEFSRLLHPSYVSIYILCAIIYYLKNKLKSKVQIIVLSILMIYLFLLASRAAFLILFIVSLILIIDVKDKRKRYMLIISYLVGLIVFVNNPRISHFYERLKDFGNKTNYNYTTSEQSRLLTLDASVKLIKNSPIVGYGIGDANQVLINKYKELGYLYNYKHRYNAHNQFLQTFLQVGILGGIPLLLLFFMFGITRKGAYEISFFIILLFSLLFESMLVRFNGIVFFAIIIPILWDRRVFGS